MLAVERKGEMQYCLNMFLRRRNESSAFTLTELLMVIAIIGILAALLLTTISQSKARAQRIQCANNLHQQGVALNVFLSDNHGYPPIYANKNDGYPDHDRSWVAQLEQVGFGISQPPTNYFEKGIWLCPSAQWTSNVLGDPPCCYGYNCGNVAPNDPNYTNSPGLGGLYSRVSHIFIPITESEVVVPSDMMAIGDSFDGTIVLSRVAVAENVKYGNIFVRHQGKANVVFCDGHVESPTLQFLFEDTSDEALSRWNRDHLPHREKLSP
jgi:prepilin-type processing-associated H-X9-DG protein/prepilin-type N-terminal cleavage/methylation domain-containing protein